MWRGGLEAGTAQDRVKGMNNTEIALWPPYVWSNTWAHELSYTWMYSHTHKCTYHIHTIQKHTQNKSVNKTTKAFGNITGAVWSSRLQLSAVFHTSLCWLAVKVSHPRSNAMNFRTLQPPPGGTEEQRLMPFCASSWCGTRHSSLGGKGSGGERVCQYYPQSGVLRKIYAEKLNC